MHYYQTQQHTDFNTPAGRQQLAVLKQRSLDQAVQSAYVQRLASINGLAVTNHDVDNAITLVNSQNRLGSNNQVLQNVLSEFWGWTMDDFRRELGQELLAQKVVDKLDTKTHNRASQALAQLQQGADFATLAKQVSDDASTRSNGGDYGIAITKSTTDIAPQVIDELFRLNQGQYSSAINTGYSLEIVKVNSIQGSEIHASHISFNFQSVSTYTSTLESKEKVHLLIHP